MSDLKAENTASRSRTLRPLRALLPFALRYKGRIIAAFAALALASGATLVVPVALRRMIDFGFAADRASEINSYFAAMMIVAAVLAGASAAR
jgi:ATP-binding cassette, subfamily B, bacterial